jgi:hypothetical protein
LTKKLRERDLGRDLESAKITLDEYLDRWLEIINPVKDIFFLPFAWITVNSGGSRNRPVFKPLVETKLPPFGPP